MNKFALTNKRIMFGNNRSKALNITKRTWKLNLQKFVFFDQSGRKHQSYLTTREIKTLKKYLNSQK